MKALIQTGSSLSACGHAQAGGRVPVPLKSDFLSIIAMTKAYREFDYQQAKAGLEDLAKQLEYRYPSAASSLREGLEETLTVHRLKVPGLLRQTLSSTNAMESANSSCARTLRRVSCFKNGSMTLRHAAAGFLEAERSFRRVRGYKQIPVLIASLTLLTVTDDGSILKSA